MHYVKVKSSSVDMVGWQEDQLFIRFLRGSVYVYDQVPHETYLALINSPSVGSFLAKEVKGYYHHKLLLEDPFALFFTMPATPLGGAIPQL